MIPTQDGFLAWIRTVMGVDASVLPDNSAAITLAYQVAIALVNQGLNAMSPFIYTQAVYNLGGDTLVNFASDVPGSTYFSDLRSSLKINAFAAGVVSSASDSGTSSSVSPISALTDLTLVQLQNLKTPWGRTYLGYAQSYGTLWGLS